MGIKKYIIYLLLFLTCGYISGQDAKEIISIDRSLSQFSAQSSFSNLPDGVGEEFTHQNIVEVTIDLAELILEEEYYGLFISDAEKQVLYVNGHKYYAGKYQNVDKLGKKWDSRHFVIPSSLLANHNIRVELQNETKGGFKVAPSICATEFIDNDILAIIGSSKAGIIFTILFLGGILVFLIYTIGLYIQTGNKDFKFYGYYLGAILLHNLIQADAFLKVFFFFPSNPICYHILNEFLQMFIYSFFMLFIKVFLDLKVVLPKMDKFVKISIGLTIAFAFIFFFTASVMKDFIFLQNYLSLLWIVVAGLGTIIVVQVYRKSTNPIRYFIMAGSIFLLIGSVLELYSSLSLEGAYNWNLYVIPKYSWYPFNFTQLAILLETVCFALGIGYKIRQKEKLLVAFQQKEIDELQDATIKKDSEIKNLAVSIASEKSLRAETTHLLELLETQYGFIQYQLNPHFLFNNLSAINNLIMHHQEQEASKYLVDFSKLLRQTINRSKNFTANLEGEKSFMANYLNLEKQRLKGRFEYKIICDELGKNEVIDVPSFIIQPYIEYCIWNHILPAKEPGLLTITFRLHSEYLEIVVTDHGVEVQEEAVIKREEIRALISKRIGLSYEEQSLPSIPLSIVRENDVNILRLKLPLQIKNETMPKIQA